MTVAATSMPAPSSRARGRQGPPGYSLMEVLFAMAILAVGLIAISSLFPVGLVEQRQAMDDAQGSIIGQNVVALLQAAGPGHPAFQAVPIGSNFTAIPAVNGLPTYQDSNRNYAYRLAARRPGAGLPVDVAVFVFRNPPSQAASQVVEYNTGIGADGVFTTPDPTGSSSVPARRYGARNQTLLVLDNGTAQTYRVIRDGEVSPHPAAALTGPVYSLGDENERQKAVAVITGIVK